MAVFMVSISFNGDTVVTDKNEISDRNKRGRINSSSSKCYS